MYPDWYFTRSPFGVKLVSSTGQKKTRNIDYLMVRALQCRCIYLWSRYVDHGYVTLVVTLPGPHSWLITGFVTRETRWMSLAEQELPTPPEHLSSPPVSGVSVTRSLVFCVMFCISLFVLLVVVLSVLLFTDSDCPFGIFKLFLDYMCTDIYTWVTIHNW